MSRAFCAALPVGPARPPRARTHVPLHDTRGRGFLQPADPLGGKGGLIFIITLKRRLPRHLGHKFWQRHLRLGALWMVMDKPRAQGLSSEELPSPGEGGCCSGLALPRRSPSSACSPSPACVPFCLAEGSRDTFWSPETLPVRNPSLVVQRVSAQPGSSLSSSPMKAFLASSACCPSWPGHNGHCCKSAIDLLAHQIQLPASQEPANFPFEST